MPSTNRNFSVVNLALFHRVTHVWILITYIWVAQLLRVSNLPDLATVRWSQSNADDENSASPVDGEDMDDSPSFTQCGEVEVSDIFRLGTIFSATESS